MKCSDRGSLWCEHVEERVYENYLVFVLYMDKKKIAGVRNKCKRLHGATIY